MERGEHLNKLGIKGTKISLRSYYKSLPGPSCPKTDLLRTLSEKCGVSIVTARNWVLYGFRPSNPEHVRIISEETGIPADELWTD